MTVGERLREARERQKVSLHAIAEKTNISVRFLDAIEKNQFGKLPGGIFTRGFIRSYAAQVGIDPDAAVAQFLSDEPGARDESDEGSAGPREGLGLPVWLGILAVLIAAVLGLAYAFGPDWLTWRRAPAPAVTSTAVAEPTSAPVSATPAPAAADPGPSPVPATLPADAGTPASAPSPIATSGPAEVAPPSPRAPLHLVVAPSARCWVQVSADGQMRVARELAAGERVTVEAAERLQIVVGNAGAFAYEINGREGRSLGAAGRVARATILPSTVSQFQVP